MQIFCLVQSAIPLEKKVGSKNSKPPPLRHLMSWILSSRKQSLESKVHCLSTEPFSTHCNIIQNAKSTLWPQFWAILKIAHGISLILSPRAETGCNIMPTNCNLWTFLTIVSDFGAIALLNICLQFWASLDLMQTSKKKLRVDVSVKPKLQNN